MLSLFYIVVLRSCKNRTLESISVSGLSNFFWRCSASLHCFIFIRVFVPENIRVLIRSSLNLCSYWSILENFFSVLIRLIYLGLVYIIIKSVRFPSISVSFLQSSLRTGLVMTIYIRFVLFLFQVSCFCHLKLYLSVKFMQFMKVWKNKN